MKRPTLTDIARRVGVTKMTVSRALRGGPYVSAELRKKIARAAMELGYKPDPEITRLMSHLRLGRAKAAPRTLAFVWSENDPADAEGSSWSRRLVSGAHQQAARLGFALEEFHLAVRGMSGRRLSTILETRGITGFILSPLLSRSRGHVRMSWEKFSSVVIGLGYARPALHRVHHHHFLGMMNAMRHLRKAGWRRIGFYSGSTIDERMYRAWSASFLAHHPLPRPEGLLALRQTTSRADFLAWIKAEQPEIVIDAGHIVQDWLKAVPEARRPLHVTLAWRPDQAQVPGIDQQAEELGASAVDLLVAQEQQHQRGVPAVPRIVMTEGLWRGKLPSR